MLSNILVWFSCLDEQKIETHGPIRPYTTPKEANQNTLQVQNLSSTKLYLLILHISKFLKHKTQHTQNNVPSTLGPISQHEKN